MASSPDSSVCSSCKHLPWPGLGCQLHPHALTRQTLSSWQLSTRNPDFPGVGGPYSVLSKGSLTLSPAQVTCRNLTGKLLTGAPSWYQIYQLNLVDA